MPLTTKTQLKDESLPPAVYLLFLLKKFLKQGGIVFGAAFTNDYKLKHIYIEHESDLHRLLGSKYIQSEIGDSYTNAKEFLKKGRKVLFTGTPCQIVGLNSFLGDSYSNLLTVDFFCHGVPSPEIWSHYLNYRCNKDNNGNLPSNIFFRKKVHGWKNYYTCFDYEKKSYSISHYKDPYMQGFKENLYLRPSCYNCIAKGTNRISDFTVADYWGVQGLCPSMYDNKGTSLVLVNSQKAKTIWGTVSNDLITKKTNLEKASQNNIASIRSVTPHPSRDAFYLRFKHEDFEKIIWDLAPYKPQPRKPLRQRVLSFLRVCYHKLK